MGSGLHLPHRGPGRHIETIRPFCIAIPEKTLADLRERIARTRWPDEIVESGWVYGTNVAYLYELLEYWRKGFDWRGQERNLNSFSHFVADVDGLDLHFLHERGRGPSPMPLIVLHGWPSTFFEMSKIVPLLVDPAAHGGDSKDSFDVVAPSLPGCGFSDRPREPGMHKTRMAELFAKLMSETLGYERKFFDEERTWMEKEGAYDHLQATKPQTLGYGLNDSPAGLAAWIVEKYRSWSDCGGDVERRFTKDEILTQLTIYWATETINSANRLYFERDRAPRVLGPDDRVQVPTAVAIFPGDIDQPPREWGERVYDVRRWTVMPRGGHFAALE